MAAASSKPTVTVVMIFLNAETYIEEAIESVLAQTFGDWELVLVDDGSTDGSTAIARRYAESNPDKIRYAEHGGHENKGMSASRNLGVTVGCGTYVSFLDSDDVWLPDRLEHFVALGEAFPQAGMIYGPTLYWYSWAEERGIEPPVPGQEDFVGHLDMPTGKLIEPPTPLREFLLSGGACLPGICSLLIRRDAYDDVGGFEQSFRGLYEDQAFLSKMVMWHPVVVTDRVLDRYRQHSESCCYRAIETGEYDPEDLHPARLRYLRWLQGYCKEFRVSDTIIRRELWRQIARYHYPQFAKLSRSAGKLMRRAVRRCLPDRSYAQLKSIYRRISGRLEA